MGCRVVLLFISVILVPHLLNLATTNVNYLLGWSPETRPILSGTISFHHHQIAIESFLRRPSCLIVDLVGNP